MGVPTSEVGYTSAMPRREGHEVHKDMWGIGGEKNKWQNTVKTWQIMVYVSVSSLMAIPPFTLCIHLPL